jgi:hypothetical protein
MIQSGLLPNTLATIDQLDDPETREKAIGGVIAIIEYGREMKITLDRLEWNARRAGQSNGYSYVYGARFEEQHIG